jgi:hypothetical protein
MAANIARTLGTCEVMRLPVTYSRSQMAGNEGRAGIAGQRAYRRAPRRMPTACRTPRRFSAPSLASFPTDAAKESRFARERILENEITRFQALKARNLAISNSPVRQK